MIDSVVVGVPYAIFESLVGGNGLYTTKYIDPQTGATVTHFHIHPTRFFTLLGLQLVVQASYTVLMQASTNQATLGMMGLGIKVTGLDGQRLTRARALGRFLAYYLNIPTAGLGLLLMLVTKRKQALHDLIANTLVVSARD